MLNTESLEAVAEARFGKGFCKPLYASYCFSRIPETIAYLLNGKGKEILPQTTFQEGPYESVVLLLIDGFGWNFLEKYLASYPFLQRFKEKGIVSKITAEFPSTTAVHITSLHTGLSSAETGIYEWFYYEPLLHRVIAPLLFSFAGDHEKETLKKTGIDPKKIYPTHTFAQRLAQEGIRFVALQEKEMAAATYSQILFQGAEVKTYTTFSQAAALLAELLSKQKEGEKVYYYLYFPDIDAMAHRHGLHSPHVDYAVRRCFHALEELFWKKLEGKRRMACFLTADHGMTKVDPKTTLYLNEAIPEIIPYLQCNPAGEPIVPVGSCRDFFLHVKEEKLEESTRMLQEKLRGKAEVYLVRKLIEEGFFGEKPCLKPFLDRVANLVILPYPGESVWWHEKHRFEQHFYAAHGGLTIEEMESPLLFLRDFTSP